MEIESSQSDWKISIQKRLDQAKKDEESNKWTNITIYRAPQQYRLVNRNCLEPKIVSLGPYHSSNRKLREADPHKWRALHYMLTRNRQKIGLYLDAIMELEQKARSCYEGNISLSKEKFVEMMVLDGCFIIEFLLSMNGYIQTMGYRDLDTFIGFARMGYSGIVSDMLLLENQIPIFVLEELCKLQKEPTIGVGFIPNRAFFLFNQCMCNPFKDANDGNEGIKGNHILDIVWKFILNQNPLVEISNPHRDEISNLDRVEKDDDTLFKFTCAFKVKETRIKFKAWKKHSNKNKKDNVALFNIPCASKLKETRIKFEALKGHPVWKVNFSDRTLQLSQLHLQDVSKTLFCNLIAYEQRHHTRFTFITEYFVFMTQLIDSPDDVQYLIERKIITSYLGSYVEVVDLLDKVTMNADVDLDNIYLQEIVNGINKHCDTTWYKWRGNLINTYFKNPWSTISFVAAFFLLVSTFIQTFYTVYSYYYPKKDVK